MCPSMPGNLCAIIKRPVALGWSDVEIPLDYFPEAMFSLPNVWKKNAGPCTVEVFEYPGLWSVEVLECSVP